MTIIILLVLLFFNNLFISGLYARTMRPTIVSEISFIRTVVTVRLQTCSKVDRAYHVIGRVTLARSWARSPYTHDCRAGKPSVHGRGFYFVNEQRSLPPLLRGYFLLIWARQIGGPKVFNRWPHKKVVRATFRFFTLRLFIQYCRMIN